MSCLLLICITVMPSYVMSVVDMYQCDAIICHVCCCTGHVVSHWSRCFVRLLSVLWSVRLMLTVIIYELDISLTLLLLQM